MDWLKRFDRFITRSIERIITVFFIIIFLLIFSLVLLRYGFKTSIMGTNEIITMLFVYCSALGTAILVRQKEHIKISFFVNKLSTGAKRIVLTINYLLICVLNAVFFYMSLGWIKSIQSFRSPMTQIPFWVQRIPIPIGCGLVILYCLYNIYLIYASSEELSHETEDVYAEVEGLLGQAKQGIVQDNFVAERKTATKERKKS
jgi:TRAP-type C4-dicarboxylate transport system permease small subunit